jgi:hypothetical protein
MIVDWHAHVYPPEMAKERRWGGQSPLTIENLLTAHEAAGIDLCVVSNTIHYLRDKAPRESLAFLRRWNEYGAEIQQKYTGRIVVFTSTLPCGGEPFLKELERAIVEYGLKGVLINSSHQGAYPDDDEAQPFFQLANDLGIPVMMHAPSVGFGEVGVERGPSFRRVPEHRATDRARRVRKISQPEIRWLSSRRRDLRSHRPHGLCLRARRQSIWLRTLRADAHYPASQRLFAPTLYGHCGLPPAGGDLRLPHGRAQAAAFRQRRAAALATASPREKNHRRASDTGQRTRRHSWPQRLEAA